MKKRNYKMISVITAISLTTALVVNPFVSTAYAKETANVASRVDSKIKIDLTEDSETKSNIVNPNFTVTNTSSETLDLRGFNLNYYYSSDSDKEETFNCYYAGTTNDQYKNLTDSVVGKIQKSDSPFSDSSTTLTIGFKDGVLTPGQSLNIKVAVNKSDWSSYDKTNDYSYNKADHVVSFLQGTIISGTDPLPKAPTPDKPVPEKPVKDEALLKETYFSFNKNTVSDINIPMSVNKDEVSYVDELTSMACVIFNEGEEYDLNGNTLTINKGYIERRLDYNPIVTVHFKDGKTENILIHNDKEDESTDPLRRATNKDEAEIAFSITPDIKSNADNSQPNIVTIRNTSRTDISLNKLSLYKFYSTILDEGSNDIIAYASIIDENKSFSSSISLDSISCLNGTRINPRYLKTSFKGSDVLKPGQTLVLAEYFSSNDYIGTDKVPSPVVTYDGESIYGSFPEGLHHKATIDTPDIVLSSEKETTPAIVKLTLNSNALTSITAYSNNELIKTLKEGIDYDRISRNEVVLSEDFLDSLDNEITNLDFAFSNNEHASISVKIPYIHADLEEGSLTISDK